jgi:hypothetical protein
MTKTMLGLTPEDWAVLESAPMLAGLAVGDLADPKRWLTELYAVLNAAEAAEGETQSVLIRAVTERMTAHEGDGIDLPVDLPENAMEARNYLIAGCVQAVRLVSHRAPDEVVAFKYWLLALARKAAESTKDGGFLGFGGERINADERAALRELEAALDAIQ